MLAKKEIEGNTGMFSGINRILEESYGNIYRQAMGDPEMAQT